MRKNFVILFNILNKTSSFNDFYRVALALLLCFIASTTAWHR